MLDTFWGHLGTFVTILDPLGVVLGPIWGHFGAILEGIWNQLGIIWESFWGHFGSFYALFSQNLIFDPKIPFFGRIDVAKV